MASESGDMKLIGNFRKSIALLIRSINWGKTRFLVLLLLLAGTGVALVYYGSKFWGHWAEGIGEALIIAGVLGLTVDAYVKEHLLKEASGDIAKYLLGYHLTDELKNVIGDLMRTERVTTDFRLHYKLSLPTETPGKVLTEITLSYCANNITNKKLPYHQSCYQQIYYSPCFQELRCDSDDEDAKYYLGPKELLEQVKSQEGQSEFKVKAPAIKLHPHNHASKPKYQFTARFSLSCPENYSDFFVLDESPTIGVVVTAEYPDSELEFQGPTPPTHVNRWEYKRVFFAGEQITLHWRRKHKAEVLSPV